MLDLLTHDTDLHIVNNGSCVVWTRMYYLSFQTILTASVAIQKMCRIIVTLV